ncbi:MAG TPA: lysoplasmalogenase family protein [Anaerolineaceae bacterium]
MAFSRLGLILVYLPTLLAYFFTETSRNFRRRAVNKILLATLFLGAGTAWFLTNGYSGWRYLGLCGLILAWLGDVVLLWSFTRGGACFAASNIFFILYEVLWLKESDVTPGAAWWLGLVFLTLMLVMMGLSRRKWIDFGRQEKLILPYLATVTGHGVLGLGLVALTRGMHPLLLGSGLALFMISDYFLMAYKFKCPRNAVLRFNSGTYFLGMLLVALSFSY